MPQTATWPPQTPRPADPWRPPIGSPFPPERRRHTARWWIALGVVFACLLGAGVWSGVIQVEGGSATSSTPGRDATDTAIGGSKVVTATDHKSQVTVPASWADLPQSVRTEAAAIQVGDPLKEQYIAVVTADKGDYEDFDAFVNATLTRADTVGKAEVGPQRHLTVGSLPAVQVVVSGKYLGINVVYWYTLVQGNNNYYLLLGWTLPSKRPEAEPVIGHVIDSFQEIGPS